MPSHLPTDRFALNDTRLTPCSESWMDRVDAATQPVARSPEPLPLTQGDAGEAHGARAGLGDLIDVPLHAIVYNGHAGLGANTLR